MKARFTFLAVPLMIGVAMAQSGQPAAQDQTAPKSGDAAATSKDASQKDASQNASTANSGKPAEMKTMMYKGTLVDLACNGGTASAAPAAAAGSTDTTAASNSADRSAGDSSCAVSANTSTFGLKTDQGQTYRFDMVGNQRAQDEFKTNKHWNSAGSKPVKVKISGVVQGDKLIVSSIH
jgi:hypothetical protein